MAKNKTTETAGSVADYLQGIKDQHRRDDCSKLVEFFTAQTGFDPKMWGTSIVGFGSYHYVYESGHEGDAPIVGFSSRAKAITLYLGCGIDGMEEKMQKLGKFNNGKGCIYIKSLKDIDIKILGQMIMTSVDYIKTKYPH